MQPAASAIAAISAAIQQGSLQLAEREAREQLRSHPRDETLLTLLGISIQMQGRAGDAVQYFEQLTQIDPDAPVHWNNLGTMLRDSGQDAAAEAAYREAVKRAP